MKLLHCHILTKLIYIFVPSKQDWRKLSLVHRTQRVDAHNFSYVDFKKSVGVQVPHLVLIFNKKAIYEKSKLRQVTVD